MAQRSMKAFFRGSGSGSGDGDSGSSSRKRSAADISTWEDVQSAHKPGIQLQPPRRTPAPSPVYSASPQRVMDLTGTGSPEHKPNPSTAPLTSASVSTSAVTGSGRKARGGEGRVRHSSIAMMVKKAAAVATEEKVDSSEKHNINDVINLSSKQSDVLHNIMQGKSVFFTGAAGTGKSHILRVLRRVMEHLKRSDNIAFTAPTGVAACNIRGLTVHAWASIGLAKEPIEQLVAKISRNKNARKRWESVEILVIDEISMLSAEVFDMLSVIGSRIRLDERPFGGIQLILCGDFFQLPPVGLGASLHLCFKAKAWQQLFHPAEDKDGDQSLFVLDKVFRQKDSFFLGMLHEMRRGEVSENTRKILTKKVADDYRRERERIALLEDTNSLSQMSQSQAAAANIKPTKLFSRNVDVDQINTEELGKIRDREFTYAACDEGAEKYLKQLRNGSKIPESITLKVGAQVMLLKNLGTARGLVNGARGVVVGFEKSQGRSAIFPQWLPVVDFVVNLGDGADTVETKVIVEESSDIKEGDKVLASRSQLPLMLAYAITVHKSQGMTIPHLEVSFRGIFEYGQAYVALSRATNLTGLVLKTFDARAVKAHPEVKQFYANLGYTGESEHQNKSTVATSVALLSELYLNSCNESVGNGDGYNHPVYARAPPQTSAWVVSRQEKANKKRREALKSLYDSSEESQVQAPTSNSSERNPFMKFEYAASGGDDDAFMERGNSAPKLPKGLEAALEPYTTPQPAFNFGGSNCPASNNEGMTTETLTILHQSAPCTSSTDTGLCNVILEKSTRNIAISDEQRRKIEANKLAALERMRMNRLKKDEEKHQLMEEYSV